MKLELRSVRLKNCGPLDDVKIDFFDASGKTLPVCVIGGANGSGKTTILEAIILTANMLGDGGKGFPALKSDSYLQTDWRFNNFECSLFNGSVPHDVILLIENWGEGDRKGGFTASRNSLVIADLRRKIGEQSSSKKKNDSLYAHIFENEEIPSIIFLPHSRSLEPVYGQEIRKESDSYQFVHRFESIRQFPGSFTSFLIWLEYAKPERYVAINQFLNNLDFDGKTFRVDRESLSVMVRTKSGAEHPLHELSSGEQNLLIILIELYRKLTPGSVVLIDEIENSLHPAFQHRLAQGLLKLQKEIPYQLIVTTHAPAFVEIFGAENTRLLTAF